MTVVGTVPFLGSRFKVVGAAWSLYQGQRSIS